MGRKSKTGKSRKDKFYHLAKETGYRARSAFKLIQLNRKYEFLQKSRVVLDLCAAPGGWLQVVSENTPMSSLIIGVDLVSIRPVRNCITLQEDITTEKCRQSLKKELQTWKADTVIHDGAPNVGKNWLHDAFQQAQLTLQALKLATEFLRKGGWFVTKVFRSKDYFSLIWVFQQLFGKVHATKPQASRNESAEIFVVCEKFLAPSKIDPKFLDPKFVFNEIDMEPKAKYDLIHPEKKKRQREGYPTGDYTLHHTLNVSEFIDSDNFLDLLAQASEVVFDDKMVENLPETTPEVKECLKDIKVLGKKEIKEIVKWRTQVRKKQGKDKKADKTDKIEDLEEESADEEDEIEEQLAKAEADDRKALKKKLKKIRKQKTKLRNQMDMKMVIPGDKHDFTDDMGLFYLSNLKNKEQLDEVEAGDTKFADEFAAENLMDVDIGLSAQQKRVTFNRDEKAHLEELYSSDEELGEEEPDIGDMEDSDDLEFEDDDKIVKTTKNKNPLLVSLEKNSTQVERKLKTWFSKEAFAGLEDEADEDIEIEKMMEEYKKKGGTVAGLKGNKNKVESEEDSGVPEDNESDDDSIQERSDGSDDESENESSSDSESESSSDSDSDFDTKEMKKNRPENFKLPGKSEFEEVPMSEALDPVGLAIGAAMVHSRKRKRDIIDGGYHRYMFDDTNLPDWFVKDEARHNKRELPVTKEEIQEYKLKERSINARPIKKMAEAKARKKKKQLRKLERARKKAETISDTADITERDKWQQIKQVYKRAGLLSVKKKEVEYVVAKKGIGRRVPRPKGVTGLYKVVDPRMKKDFINKKKQSKTKGNKKGGKKQGVKQGGRRKK